MPVPTVTTQVTAGLSPQARSSHQAEETCKLGPGSQLKRAAAVPRWGRQAVATWECGPSVVRPSHFLRRAKAPDFYVKFLDF